MKHLFKQHKVQILINLCAIVIVAVMLIVSRAIASPNTSSAESSMSMDVLSYQGTLLDNSDNPVNGDTDMTFRIYNHDTDPTSIWEEAHTGVNAVPVENGLFNVMLGSLNPIPDLVWNEAELYLGIQVGTDPEMSPREMIAAVPVAHNAMVAQTVPHGSLNSTHVNFTSGSKMATDNIELSTSYQIIPGMQSTITLETPQTVFFSFTVYFTSQASSGYGTARVKFIGDGGTFAGPLIVASWPSTDTYTQSYLFDLPAGTYEIQVFAKSYSGEAFVSSAWTNMIWFTFSQ